MAISTSGSKVTAIIPAETRERFLLLTPAARAVLPYELIADAGVSHTFPPYRIGRRHFEEQHVLIYTLGGEGQLIHNRKNVPLLPGKLCVLPAGCDHSYAALGDWHILWFHLKPTPFWNHVVGEEIRVRRSRPMRSLHYLAEMFLDEAKAESAEPSEVLERLAGLMVIFLQREKNSPLPPREFEKHTRLEALWRAVSEQPGKRWNSTALCRHCHMSRTRLHELCKKLYGMGMMEKVTHLRMEQAAHLLLHTNYKLTFISERAGYATPFAFSRAFKRAMGMSPENWRQRSGRRGPEATPHANGKSQPVA